MEMTKDELIEAITKGIAAGLESLRPKEPEPLPRHKQVTIQIVMAALIALQVAFGVYILLM
jgi:hypothetical protein